MDTADYIKRIFNQLRVNRPYSFRCCTFTRRILSFFLSMREQTACRNYIGAESSGIFYDKKVSANISLAFSRGIKVSNGNSRTLCEICLKLTTIKAPERRQCGLFFFLSFFFLVFFFSFSLFC